MKRVGYVEADSRPGGGKPVSSQQQADSEVRTEVVESHLRARRPGIARVGEQAHRERYQPCHFVGDEEAFFHVEQQGPVTVELESGVAAQAVLGAERELSLRV